MVNKEAGGVADGQVLADGEGSAASGSDDATTQLTDSRVIRQAWELLQGGRVQVLLPVALMVLSFLVVA